MPQATETQLGGGIRGAIMNTSLIWADIIKTHQCLEKAGLKDNTEALIMASRGAQYWEQLRCCTEPSGRGPEFEGDKGKVGVHVCVCVSPL